MKGEKRIKSIWLWIVFILALILAVGIFLIYAVYHGIILLNHPSKNRYPIRGVDVSHYQGNIDWELLSTEEIEYAYIKATEGSSHIDKKFIENWNDAKDTRLRIGAYHFFSFDSGGDTQLTHFIDVVPDFPEMLPPVVDFEFYGDKKINPPDVGSVTEHLRIMLEGLKEYYGVDPVIYATEDSYNMYLKGSFDEYPLWIRNVIRKPAIERTDWIFWQYSNRGRLKGYSGEETFIDLNVFSGSESDWESWSQSFEKRYNKE